MSKLIAFSGGCCSGKTSTIELVKEKLTAAGYNVKIISENMRELDVFKQNAGLTIDALRKDVSMYLSVQESIIPEKAKRELEASIDESDTIYLIDRALSDSIFYLQCYVNKSELSQSDVKRYYLLHNNAITLAQRAFTSLYDIVLEFTPLSIVEKDVFRPQADLGYSNKFEYDAIHILNNYFCPKEKLIKVDLNTTKQLEMVEKIINMIK